MDEFLNPNNMMHSEPRTPTAVAITPSPAPHAALISQEEVATLLHGMLTTGEGAFQTEIPFLSLIRSTHPTQFSPGITEPSLCLIVQGCKRSMIAGHVIPYDAGSFLVTSIDMPITGHVVEATPTKPYLGIKMTLAAEEVTTVMMESRMNLPDVPARSPRAYIGKASSELRDAMFRLIRLLGTPDDIPFIATAIKKEVIYRLLRSEYGPMLYHNVVTDYSGVGISKAILMIKQEYREPLSVERLAREVNMSVSGFHHKFKAVTSLSPIQYQKRLRLLEARHLLLAGTMDAATAALNVGYESPSQFSREYRRLFGAPPLQDIDALKQAMPTAVEQF